MNRLSACLITLNEERNLPRALRSLEGVADEIIVVDCGSQDRTQEIARAYKAKAIIREWTDFAQQKNFAAASASGDWRLCWWRRAVLSWRRRQAERAVKQEEPEFRVYEVARRA